MKTAYCPKTHTELAKSCAGKPYGHVPGHTYDDVDVVISRARDGRYRVHAVESWGSAQGYDEEHGRIEAIGRGETITVALDDAYYKAMDRNAISLSGETVGFNMPWLSEAMDKAEDEADSASD